MTPDKLPALYQAGDHSLLVNKLDEAAWCFEQAAMLDPVSPRPLKGLAQVRHFQERPAEARALLQRAIAFGSDTADSYKILGQMCQAEGDFPAAIAAFERAISIDPSCAHAQLRLALLPRPGVDPAARIGMLERLLERTELDTEQRAVLGFALGREYETADDPECAFAAYQSANGRRRTQYPGYGDTFRSADPLISVFSSEFLAARRGLANRSARPVFIVGMMRSGTTLVEQIVASHPAVHGHGELTDMRQIARALASELASAGAYPGCLAALAPELAHRSAARYLARLERDAAGAAFSIDKLPHNFENLGLISLLFPHARVIHCTRDPLDTCVSNYFQDFGATNPFTYELGALGQYHREYTRLMDHWARVLPNPMLTIPYEALVADQEGWSRRAIAFLGLDWDPACLEFHTNPRPVYTKSLWQVRQPIFASGIGRSRPYLHHLGPLVAALGGVPNRT